MGHYGTSLLDHLSLYDFHSNFPHSCMKTRLSAMCDGERTYPRVKRIVISHHVGHTASRDDGFLVFPLVSNVLILSVCCHVMW